MTGATLFHYVLFMSFIFLGLAAILAFLRALFGPYTSQRVVALDFLTNVSIASIACFAAWQNNPIYLNVIIGLALVILLGTLAYAFYLQASVYKKDEPHD